MFRWLPYPFLRFTPVFIFGILLAIHFSCRIPSWTLLLPGVLYAGLAYLIPARYRSACSGLTGLLGLLLLLLTAILYTNFRQVHQKIHHIVKADTSYTHYIATVKEAAEKRANSYRSVLSVDYLLLADSSKQIKQQPASGRIIVYQPLEDSLRLLKFGQQILVKGQPQLVREPMNPNEFDYRQYLAYQYIHHQQYLPDSLWINYGHQAGNPVLAFANRIRRASQQLFHQAIPDSKARGIALALVLGIKHELADDIRSAYAAAGAMHVLAVSGLHVGIIYLVISFLLRPLKSRGRWGHLLLALICLLSLWAYAFLTGLSASVLRATVMFSFIIIAQATRRQTNIYNTIFASAFFLLLYDPYLIMSVGFQLSYLAVLGIVYLQPKIYQWVAPANKYLDWLWSLTAVSIAAQLVTFPLGLYYFQQFPVFFWLSNILVIPAAYVILSLGLLCLLTGFIAFPLLFYPGWLLEKCIQVLNYGVVFIEKMPYSVLKGLYFSAQESLLIYLAIIFMLLLFSERKFSFVLLLSCCLLLLSASRIHRIYRHEQSTGITFFHVPKASHMSLFTGRNNFHLGTDDEKSAYHIQPHYIYKSYHTHYLNDSLPSPLALGQWQNTRLIVWQGQKAALITGSFTQTYRLPDKVELDLLVICNNAVRKLDEVNELFDYRRLIIDSSNSYYRARSLAAQAEQQNIPYHCVPLQGAFTYQIQQQNWQTPEFFIQNATTTAYPSSTASP